MESSAPSKQLGWQLRIPGLLTKRFLIADDGLGRTLQLYYQHTPQGLATGSRYREIQNAHKFPNTSGLIPDLVMGLQAAGTTRWLLIEVKGGPSGVADNARAAALDLLAYRRAYSPVLDAQSGRYGLGYAWGIGLAPAADAELALCTPDTLASALELLLS